MQITCESQKTIVLDSKTGYLLEYTNLEDPLIPSEYSKDDIIDLDYAKSLLNQITDALGHNEDEDKLYDWSNNQATPGFMLETRLPRYHAGIKCISRSITFSVEYYKGMVRDYIDKPVIIPERMVENISQQEASRIALDFLQHKFDEPGVKPEIGDVEKVISLVNLQNEEKVESRLVWDVQFQIGSGNIGYICIDTETGEVLTPHL